MNSLTKLKISKANEIIEKLEYFYNCNLDKLKKSSIYINEKTQKLYLFTGDLAKINIKKMNSLGLYLGTLHDNNRFRLSIDGSRLISAKQNFIKLNEKSLKTYISGENLFTEEVKEINKHNNCPFLIIKYKNENLGCCNIKDKEIFCYVPKSRRLNASRIF